MEVLSPSLNMAASSLTTLATLAAIAREILERRHRSNEYAVQQSYGDNELTDNVI
jgi:hypothetical protein